MPGYAWSVLTCWVSLMLGITIGYYIKRSQVTQEVTTPDPNVQLASRIVHCISGLVGIMHISPAEAVRTTAIRLSVFGDVDQEVGDFLFTLATVWSDDTTPDRVTIRPENVQVILAHSSSLRVAQAALNELYNHRMALPK